MSVAVSVVDRAGGTRFRRATHHPSVPRLASGRFRTSGRHSAATVRGNTGVITERCDGTLTQVTKGSATVRDFRLGKTVVGEAGEQYLAQRR